MTGHPATRIESLGAALGEQGYIADSALATTLLLMQDLERPLLIEGEAGVGKTAVAAALAGASGTNLIRIQCFEGIDASAVLYEWNYTRQLLHIRWCESTGTKLEESSLYTPEFLLERPLLQAIRQQQAPVLLIDEVDRADEAFEAFLLEVLSEFTVSIPEIGTLKARSVPMVVLTSNGTRDLSDALRRRCLFHYLDYPTLERELAIVRLHVPLLDTLVAGQLTAFVQRLREHDLARRPGVAETIDWARALSGFGIPDLGQAQSLVEDTLACLVKTVEDRESVAADNLAREILREVTEA